MIEKRALTSGQLDLSFSRRTLFIGGVQAAIGTVVAARMGYISIFENERYKLLSESNRINRTLIPPRRGWLQQSLGYYPYRMLQGQWPCCCWSSYRLIPEAVH